MEHTIHHITNKLEARLPDDSDNFRPSELLEAGIPSFVVERVKIELFRNLSESIVPPETDWANMDSERVETSWQSFIEAIRAEAHLPKGFVHPVLETAVADILEVLTKPRTTLPDLIFGVDDALNFETMLERKKSVVVFTYLVDILPRYMEKKELDAITRQQCEKIIHRVDERVTANYTPLNWVQLLEPLFELCSGNVDSELLRLFFEDKQNEELANCFDEEPGDVTRRQTIEILSGYHLKDSRNDEEVDGDKKAAKNYPSISTGKRELQADTERESVSDKQKEGSDKESQESSHFHSYFEDEEAEAENKPLHTMFGSGDADERKSQKPVPNKVVDVEENENELADANTDANEPDEVKDDAVEESEEDLPIWQKFAKQQENSQIEENEGDNKEARKENDNHVNASNSTREKQNSYQQLAEHLAEREHYFTEHIFDNDNKAYHNALRELAGFNTWSMASRHLQHEVFKRNMVDIFAEPAVDFTDHLQNFYNEYKTQR